MNREEYLMHHTRTHCKRGADLPQTKLTEDDILAIRDAQEKRELLRQEINEKYSNAALAKAYGVHVRTIEKVLSYETGAHVF